MRRAYIYRYVYNIHNTYKSISYIYIIYTSINGYDTYIYIYMYIYVYVAQATLYVRTVSWGHKAAHWALSRPALIGQALRGPPGPSWAGP